MENYYNDLNIPVLSPINEVKRAYRKLAQRYHPDKNLDNQTPVQDFIRISKAYEFLKDKQRKEKYDNDLSRYKRKIKIQHDLSLVKEYIKKPARRRSKIIFMQKITHKNRQCEKCEGYGQLLNRFSFPTACPHCDGTGIK